MGLRINDVIVLLVPFNDVYEFNILALTVETHDIFQILELKTKQFALLKLMITTKYDVNGFEFYIIRNIKFKLGING